MFKGDCQVLLVILAGYSRIVSNFIRSLLLEMTSFVTLALDFVCVFKEKEDSAIVGSSDMSQKVSGYSGMSVLVLQPGCYVLAFCGVKTLNFCLQSVHLHRAMGS